jgi:hypothetical protein
VDLEAEATRIRNLRSSEEERVRLYRQQRGIEIRRETEQFVSVMSHHGYPGARIPERLVPLLTDSARHGSAVQNPEASSAAIEVNNRQPWTDLKCWPMVVWESGGADSPGSTHQVYLAINGVWLKHVYTSQAVDIPLPDTRGKIRKKLNGPEVAFDSVQMSFGQLLVIPTEDLGLRGIPPSHTMAEMLASLNN